MNSIRLWQWTFLIGVTALLLSSVLVFGPSLFAAIATAVAISIGVINLLLSKPVANNNNRLLSALKETLNVNRFLKAATVTVWLATLSISSYGGLIVYSDFKERQKITIEGLVLTAGDYPADKATVVLYLKQGNLQTVTSNGKFTFAKIDLSAETIKKVKIHAHLGSKEGEAEIDLSTGGPQNLVIKLSPGDPPFRVTYFLLEDQAINFLLQGKVDERWEAKLAGQPFIVPNRVYQSLSRLIKNFSKNSVAISVGFYKEEGGRRSEPQSGQNPIKSSFVGSSDGGFVPIYSAAPELLGTLTDNKQQWRVFLDPVKKASLPDTLVFRKFVNQQDLALLSHEPIGKFYEFITKEYMPPDFGYVELYLSGVCGDDPPQYVWAKYIGRKLSLRIAVIENVTNEPIKLGPFAIRENATEKIYSQDENSSLLEKNELKRETWFPMELLKPGEKIIIPIEMQLGIDKDRVSNNLIIAANNQDLYNELQLRQQLYFLIPEIVTYPVTGVSIPSTAIEAMLSKSTSMVTLEKEYLLGPSIRVENLKVDNVEFPFRQFDPAKIIIFDESDSGSCPYVYTYSSEDKAWRNEGVILYGRTGLREESLDEKQLSRFDGRILIKEKDPEDSFIDSIYIKAISENGDVTMLYPRNRALRSNDGNRIKLKQGEQLMLFFDIPKDLKANKYVLGAVGYYVPYRPLSNPISQSSWK